MSFPTSLTTRTVKGRFVTYPGGAAAKGNVRIVLTAPMRGPSDDTFVAPFDITIPLDSAGEFSVVLPATDDPDWTPSSYRVTIATYDEVCSHRTIGKLPKQSIIRHILAVPYNSTDPIDLADVVNIPAPAAGESYVLLSSLGVPSGIATLGDDGYVVSTQLPPGSGGEVGPVSWTDVTDKPATFPPSAHVHPTSDVTDLDATLASKATTAALTSGLSTKASTTDLSTGLAGKANTVHSHIITDVASLQSSLDAKASYSDLSAGLANKSDITHTHSFDSITSKPDTYPNDPVEWDDILNKPTTFPGAGDGGGPVEWTDILDKPSTFTPSVHTHAQSDVTGLSTALAAKADSSSVTTSLVAKADLVGGVIPTAQLPAIAVIDFLGSVSTQVAMLALTGQKGDWCIRTDLGQTWVITGGDPTQLASWTAMPLASVPVQTVNGQTGTVVLGKSDVGLGNVDNTTDAGKPVSTAQQTALDAKAPLASPSFIGTVSGVTAAMVGLGNVTNTADSAKPVSTAQQTALDTKAPLASPAFTGTVTGITKAMVGLNNIDNTADTAKPVSTAQQSALDAKAPLASPAFTGTVTGVTKSMVGLGNVDNTADASKPVSTAQQSALDAKAPLASPTFTGTVTGVTAAMVGLGSVNNTADTAKPVSTAQQTALDAKAPLASPTLTGTPAAPTATAGASTTQIATTAFVTTADALKAPLASPTLTGTPAAPTATAGTNTTQIATTAFVTTAVAAGGGGAPAWSSVTAKPDWLVDREVSLRKWYAALANRHYSPAKIAVIGDSLSEGVGASVFGRAWVPQTLARLRNRFPVSGVAGGQGFVASWDNPGYGGGAPSYTYPVGQNSGSYSQTQGFAMKSNTLVATGDQMNYTFVGTSVHVWYIKQTTGGTFSVTIDGTVVQSSVVTAGTLGGAVWTSAALTPGTHTILVTRIAGGGGGTILFNGFRIFNGDESAGIQMFNGGQSGLTSGNFLTNATNADSWAPWLTTIAPQLVILELGLNDWAQNVAMATFQSNMASLLSTIRTAAGTDPSIIIYAATEANYDPSYTQTFAQLYAAWKAIVAADSKTCLFDLTTRIPAPITDTSDSYYYDTLHPSDKGHSAIADRLVSFLEPL